MAARGDGGKCGPEFFLKRNARAVPFDADRIFAHGLRPIELPYAAIIAVKTGRANITNQQRYSKVAIAVGDYPPATIPGHILPDKGASQFDMVGIAELVNNLDPFQPIARITQGRGIAGKAGRIA